MTEVAKGVVDKISSYNIFNNFFPGIIFCYIIEKTTVFSIANGEFLENLFIYYLVGMILSRIGSIFIEKFLKKLQIKNRKTKDKEPFLKFAPYEKYIEASETQPTLQSLSESNNTYRTMSAVFITVIIVKLYEWLVYDLIQQWFEISEEIIFFAVCLGIVMLFIFSYKKQTYYISSRVEKYSKTKNCF